MSFIRRAAVISLLFWASAAHAQQTSEIVALQRGETVEVSLGEAGAVVMSRGAAPAMPEGARAGAELMASMTVDKPTQEIVPLPSGGSGLGPSPVDAVRFTFAQVPGSDDVLLTIENGYARALSYRAFITVDGDRTHTDVCLVAPGRPMHEHWPYEIDSIELLEFELHDWRPGDPTPCS